MGQRRMQPRLKWYLAAMDREGEEEEEEEDASAAMQGKIAERQSMER